MQTTIDLEGWVRPDDMSRDWKNECLIGYVILPDDETSSVIITEQ